MASKVKIAEALPAPEPVGVNIVIADHGWILERLAREIADQSPHIRISDKADPSAGLQYYLNYSSWRGRLSPIEVAYFTHVEADDAAMRHFFAVASEVDYCVCHSKMYERQLRDRGIQNVKTISPGIDLDRFRPVVKIGVVGRTYASGRKGETLVEGLQEVAGIEWHFTGAGWPGPARDVSHEDMPAFYNEMDFILVPSLYEGGPMAVVEAIACGTPVIAPPVGWVSEFPHREFRAGDIADLRRVLEEVVAERAADRASLAERSWKHWALEHERLFGRLLGKRGMVPAPAPAPRPEPVLLALHSGEAASGGGPSVRVAGTAEALRELGVKARVVSFPDRTIRSAALVHGFNLWQLGDALGMARYARSLGKPFVFSPIYLDQSEQRLWQDMVPAAARQARDAGEFEALVRQAVEDFATDGRPRGQAAPGYDAAARALVELADAVIFLSEKEREALARIGAVPAEGRVVANPVDANRFAAAHPEQFEALVNARDYILCVGRIEPRKNQLMLLHALAGINVPIVLLGAETDPGYAMLIESLRTANVRMPGRIDPSSPLVASAFAGARLVVQPSWSEGAPITALEGAAAGASLILSNRSAEREYLGDLARYCDPSDPVALRNAILNAYETLRSRGERRAQQEMVRERYSYERHSADTLAVYEAAWARFKPASASAPRLVPAPTQEIILDLTSLVYRAGPSGLVAGERAIARAMIAQAGADVRFVAWNAANQRFVNLDHSCIDQEDLLAYVDFATKSGLFPANLPAGASLVVLGGNWMEDSRYCRDLVAFADTFGLSLAVLVHDLKGLHPGETSAAAAKLRQNFDTILSAASMMISVSAATTADLERFAADRGLVIPPTRLIRLGDGLTAGAQADPTFPVGVAMLDHMPYVLTVAPAGVGDSERLLFRIWQREVERLGEACPLLLVTVPCKTGEAPGTIKIKNRPDERILIVSGLTDGQLARLFDLARLVVVAPGVGGGWQPVITEALSRGRICLASTGSAAEEAGGGQADLIDPLDLPRWIARLEFYLRSDAARREAEARIVAGFTPTSWTSTRQALRTALAVSGRSRTTGNYTIGLPAQLRDRPNGVRKRGGWHRAESWGCWSSARTASFSFSLPDAHMGDLVLLMETRSQLTATQDNVCDILVNDQPAGRIVLRGPHWSLNSLHIPAGLIANATEVQIEIRGSRLVELPVDNPVKTPRKVGIAVATMALVDPRFEIDYAGYAIQPGSAHSALLIGEDVDLTRDPRALAMMPSAATIGTDWGARHMNARPQLLLKLLDRGDEDLVMTLRYRAVASPAEPLRATVATREGAILGTIEAADDAIREVQLRVPRSLKVQPLLLDFIGVEKRTPCGIGVGLREEAFGIGFFGVRFARAGDPTAAPARPIEPYRLNQTITFRQYDPDRAAVPSTRFLDPRTWHEADANGTWTQGASGRVTLALDQRPAQALHLRIDAAFLFHSTDPFTAVVHVNGREVHAHTRWNDGPFTMLVEVDPLLIGADAMLAIDIAGDHAFSPSLWGLGVDDRKIAIQVRALRIAEDRESLINPEPEVELAPEVIEDPMPEAAVPYAATDVSAVPEESAPIVAEAWIPSDRSDHNLAFYSVPEDADQEIERQDPSDADEEEFTELSADEAEDGATELPGEDDTASLAADEAELDSATDAEGDDPVTLHAILSERDDLGVEVDEAADGEAAESTPLGGEIEEAEQARGDAVGIDTPSENVTDGDTISDGAADGDGPRD